MVWFLEHLLCIFMFRSSQTEQRRLFDAAPVYYGEVDCSCVNTNSYSITQSSGKILSRCRET